MNPIASFIGVLDKSVKVIIAKFSADQIEDGDIFVTNDPYYGGVTHLNDIVVMAPVFANGGLIAWTANIAHNSDVGGRAPGSMSADATEIFQEGLRLPAIKLIARGQPLQSVFDILTVNSRMPDVLRGDVWAAIASVRVGAKRVQDLARKYNVATFSAAMENYMDFGEIVARAELAKLPKGTFELSEEQDDGQFFHAKITLTDNEFIVDLTNNPDQAAAPINTSRDGVMLSAQMIFKAITDPHAPANGGAFRPIRLITRKGSVFDPIEPAPLGFYYEIELRIYDIMWRCLARVMPEKLGAGHFSSVCGTFIGGINPDTGRQYTIIEPQIGGWGAMPGRDGVSAMFSSFHGETYNCPAEINEARNGLYVDQMTLNCGPGGEGEFTGGRGIIMDYRIRAQKGFLTAGYTRSKFPAWGMNGGAEGSPNIIEFIPSDGRPSEFLSFVSELPTQTNDVIRVITGNGGGIGNPKNRDPLKVTQDIKNGYLSDIRAAEIYRRSSQ